MYSRLRAFMPRTPLLFLRKFNIFYNFSESEIFQDAQTGPFAQEYIEHDGQERHPGIINKYRLQQAPTHDVKSKDGYNECFHGKGYGGARTFFDLGGDEPFHKRNDNQNRQNGNRDKPRAAGVGAFG